MSSALTPLRLLTLVEHRHGSKKDNSATIVDRFRDSWSYGESDGARETQARVVLSIEYIVTSAASWMKLDMIKMGFAPDIGKDLIGSR